MGHTPMPILPVMFANSKRRTNAIWTGCKRYCLATYLCMCLVDHAHVTKESFYFYSLSPYNNIVDGDASSTLPYYPP